MDLEETPLKKHIQTKDVTVCIMEFEHEFPNLGHQIINPFLYCCPFDDGSGGENRIYSPFHDNGMRRNKYTSEELLFKAYQLTKKRILMRNPNIKVLYEGKILLEEFL